MYKGVFVLYTKGLDLQEEIESTPKLILSVTLNKTVDYVGASINTRES